MMESTRDRDCLSDFRLDQLLAAELDPARAVGARGHLAGCASCSARLDQLEADRDRFRAAVPRLAPRRRAPQPSSLRRFRRWLVPAGAIAAAAVVALIVAPRPDAPVAPGNRIKGTERIGYYVKRGEDVWAGGVDETLHPGDDVQFVYTAAEPGYVAIASIDGDGVVSIYYPDGARAARYRPASDEPLPGSIVLDDATGVETIIAVFCSTPVPVDWIRDEVAAQRELDGCRVDRVRWRVRR